MKMPTKKTLYTGMIALGVVLVVVWLVAMLVFRTVEFTAIGGLGGGLIVLVLLLIFYNLYFNYKAKKHPEAYRKSIIEVKDERNIILWEKALAHANLVMCSVFVAVSLPFYLIGAEWYVIVIPWGLFAINYILFVAYYNYYKKRL